MGCGRVCTDDAPVRGCVYTRLTMSPSSWMCHLCRTICDKFLLYVVLLHVSVALLQDLRLSSIAHRTLAYDWHGQSLYLDAQENKVVFPDDVQIFKGSATNLWDDSFKEVLLIGDNVLVGSKNALYQLYLGEEQLSVRRTITWSPTENEIRHCQRLGKQENQCHNYIRVISQKSENEILLCGTNACSPSCRTYRETEDGFTMLSSGMGIGQCPFEHTQNSTAVYSDGQLYSGTVADLSSRDALIYRKPMRTEQHDSQWLNDPDFVQSFAHNDKVYFLFRESAIENINCGKALYSRIGRVCKNDVGGNLVLKNTWTSFHKSRFNCSIPGEFPFYFDEIQSSTELGQGNYRSTLTRDDRYNMVYAVFTTPSNSISGSAVCAYKMSDVERTFEGPFKAQKSAHSNWLPVKESETPTPHPAAACHNNTKQISDSDLTFIKSHPLMDQAVPAFGGRPIMVQASFSYRMTQIAVDWQYRAVDRRHYDVLFVGTDDGRIIKAVNKNRSDKIETVVIEDMVVFPDKNPVTKIQLYRSSRARPIEHLLVVSEEEVRILPLHRCHVQDSCSSCVALQDPYCSWDVDKNRCINLLGPDDMDTRYFYQSIETGKHSQCQSVSSTTQSTQKVTAAPPPTTTSTTSRPPCEPCTCDPQNLPTPLPTRVTPPQVSNVESRLTMPQRDETTEYSKELPPISREPEGVHVGKSVGGSGPCAGEKIAIAVIVPSIVFSIVGFFIGFVVSRRCFSNDKPQNNHFEEANHKKTTENTYSQDPANKFVTSPPFPAQGGKVKIFHNATKQCNLKVANGSVEAIVEPHKEKKVYV